MKRYRSSVYIFIILILSGCKVASEPPTSVISLTQTNTPLASNTQPPTFTASPIPMTPTNTITLQPTIELLTDLVPPINNCIDASWLVFAGPLYESPIIYPKNNSNCINPSESGFLIEKHPINGENSLHLYRKIENTSTSSQYIYLSHSLNQSSHTIQISIFIELIESYNTCTSQNGGCDVDLVVGIGKYPSYSQGQFILFRVPSSYPIDILVCHNSSIDYACYYKSDNWIESYVSQKSILNIEIIFEINEKLLNIDYGDKGNIYSEEIRNNDKRFWIGYDIRSLGVISAYIIFR